MKLSKMSLVPSLVILASVFASTLFAGPPEGAYVQLFGNKDMKGSAVMVKDDVPDMKSVVTDDGKKGFDDRSSSAKYDVPAGWEVVLYADANYQKRVNVLKGTGEVKDLSKGEDKISSLRWEQR